MNEFDVVICGGGLVGLTLANALHRSHLRVAVIDGQRRPQQSKFGETSLKDFELQSAYAPRVSAINIASKRLLERLDVWQDLSRFCAFDKMSVKDGCGSAQIEFEAGEVQLESLGYIVENEHLLVCLANKLEDKANTTLYWQTKLESLSPSDSGYDLVLSDSEISCRLLIGADGGNSRIRELSNMKTIRWRYGQEALVSTIRTEKPHDYMARQWFTDEGPLAFLPLQDPHLCSIVWSMADVTAHKQASAENFCQRLYEASEKELGHILGADKRFSFPLTQQHSLRYVKSNLALIGDAAHTIHPLAGQGANLGFADAAALASELMQGKFSDLDIGNIKLLRRYELARQGQNILMASVMEAFKRIYTTGDPGINWLRNTGMKIVNDSALLKTMAMRLASGL